MSMYLFRCEDCKASVQGAIGFIFCPYCKGTLALAANELSEEELKERIEELDSFLDAHDADPNPF